MTNNNIYTDNLQELYRELILDHARAPHNFSKMSDATHSAQGINPLCGDKLNIYLNINNKNEIKKYLLKVLDVQSLLHRLLC